MFVREGSQTHTFNIPMAASVRQLKEMIQRKLDKDPTSFELLWSGRRLNLDDTLSDSNLHENTVIQLVLQQR